MKCLFAWLLLTALSVAALAQSGFQPGRLETEHLVNPLGTDAAHPRFSWTSGPTTDGTHTGSPSITGTRTAGTIVVGTDSASVAAGRGDTWRHGIQAGEQSLVVYAGPALQPFIRYWWTIRDGSGGPGPIAHFETGMLDQANWRGSWITDTRDIRTKPAAYFRHAFQLQSKTVVAARVYIAAAGLYELSINGHHIGDRVLDPMYTRFDPPQPLRHLRRNRRPAKRGQQHRCPPGQWLV